MKQFNTGKYERQGFEGIDDSLDISLNEYGMGLIWKRYSNRNKKRGRQKGDYLFVSVCSISETERVLCHFWVNENVKLEDEFNWVDWEAITEWSGVNYKDFMSQSFPMKITDLVGYYGIENFATPY